MSSNKERFLQAERDSNSSVIFLFHDIENKTFLVQVRSMDKPLYPGAKLMPGGHIRKGESVEDALFREVQEELDVLVSSYSPMGNYNYLDSRGEEKEAFLFYVTGWEGNVVNNSPEEGEIEWVGIDELIQGLDVYPSQAMVLLLFAKCGLLKPEHFQQMPDLPVPGLGDTIDSV